MASRRHDEYDDAPEGRVLGRIDTYCERGITALVLLVLVYSVLAWGAVRLTEFAVVQGATALVLVLWAVRLWVNRRLRLFWPPICWSVLAFVVYAIARCHYVEIAYPAHANLNQVLVYGALFLAIVNNVNRRDYTTLISLTLIAVASALAIVAFIQFAGHAPPRIWGAFRASSYGTRGSGTFISPDNFAGFVELIAPIALAYALMGRFKPATKVILAYATFVLLAGICVSVSRAGIIAAGVSFSAFLLVLLFQPGYRIRAAVMLTLVLVAGAFALSKADVLKNRFRGINGDVGLRTHMWSMAYQLYQKDPVWGIGPGHYNHEFWPYRQPAILRLRPVHAHNDYVETLCEWGTVGILLIAANLALLALGVWRTWAFVRRDPSELGSRNSSKAAFVFGACFGLLAILIHCFTDFHMHVPAIALCVVALMAQLTVQLRFTTERYWVNPRLLGRCALSAVALVGAIWIAIQAQHGFREYYWLNQAYSERGWTPKYLGLLRNAAAIDSTNPQTLYDLGDCLRCMGDAADPENPELYKEALVWFDHAAKVDPYNPMVPMRYGMCLDSLGKTSESAPYFEKACALDPLGNLAPLYQARHFLIVENYTAARESVSRSLKAYYTKTGEDFLFIIDDRLARQPGKPRH